MKHYIRIRNPWRLAYTKYAVDMAIFIWTKPRYGYGGKYMLGYSRKTPHQLAVL